MTGVPDNKRVTVSITNVNGAGVNVAASMGFLAGDVNASKSVTAVDILRAKGRLTQAANGGNYLYDTDLSGTIDSSDINAIKQRAGLVMP